MIFEKQISNSDIAEPMGCSCGTTYDPSKSQSKHTADQKTNANTCSTKG